ncbi:probable G-protein coupled receptor Mth-like 1 [Uranotaenia lowii]|uniref:probable G-protein coupled receptor Mth-like 1 n=1 Tax=Uranotaenia lowii TaxID=190385 RepID=UPI0024790C68|nr:probable G-protein coupled receptor Mth-like 1 [Uranotaenia lowii]
MVRDDMVELRVSIVHQTDFKTTILNGNSEEVIFMQSPNDDEEKPLRLETSGKRELTLILYVEDILTAGEEVSEVIWIKTKLLQMKDLLEVKTFLEMTIKRDIPNSVIEILQSGYVGKALLKLHSHGDDYDASMMTMMMLLEQTIMMHFFFLAAFFWLNTMCFNIWWTFRDLRPTSLEKSQEICRLRIYEVYAWGVPLVIAGVAAILDNLADTVYLRPRFGERTCWFYGDMEILTYFYGPVGILLCINLLLFASTARQLTCGLWKRDDVKSTTERAALGRVCMKLVVVMGVTWVADVASWVFGGPDYIWLVTDLINALQGVFIFIVVGCQPQVWSAMKRLWNSKTGRSFTNTTHGPQHSSSSHGLPSMGESITNNTCTNNTTTTTNSQTTTTRVPMETVC